MSMKAGVGILMSRVHNKMKVSSTILRIAYNGQNKALSLLRQGGLALIGWILSLGSSNPIYSIPLLAIPIRSTTM